MYKLIIENLNNRRYKLTVKDILLETEIFHFTISEYKYNSFINYIYHEYVLGSINFPVTSSLYGYYMIIYNIDKCLDIHKYNITKKDQENEIYKITFDNIVFIGIDM